MDKLNYSNDTTAVVPGAALNVARRYLSATGNSTHGYFGGGDPGPVSTMEKVTYASDTTAVVPGAALSLARAYVAATGNSTAGYFGGGYPGPRSTMDKLTYASDTTAAVPGAALSSPTTGLAAASARANALPFADPPTPTPTSTTVPVPAPTPNTGYIGGGKNPSTTSSVEKISYASETTGRIPGANLSVARSYLTAVGTPSVGYFCGGGGSVVDKTTYESDTTARVPGANLSVSGDTTTSMGNTTQGYILAYAYPSRSDMMKLTYSSETTATLPATANLSVPARANMSISNTTHGYTAGGKNDSTSAFITNVDKTTFSTDTTARIPGSNLGGTRYSGATTGNSTTGYFGAGAIPGQPTTDASTVEKITYSSDTRANVPSSGNLSAGGRDLSATGNTTAGYFLGGKVIPGFALTSKVDRLTYATETRATVPGAKLDAARGEGGQNATGARANGRSDATAVPVPVII